MHFGSLFAYIWAAINVSLSRLANITLEWVYVLQPAEGTGD